MVIADDVVWMSSKYRESFISFFNVSTNDPSYDRVGFFKNILLRS